MSRLPSNVGLERVSLCRSRWKSNILIFTCGTPVRTCGLTHARTHARYENLVLSQVYRNLSCVWFVLLPIQCDCTSVCVRIQMMRQTLTHFKWSLLYVFSAGAVGEFSGQWCYLDSRLILQINMSFSTLYVLSCVEEPLFLDPLPLIMIVTHIIMF